MDLKDDKSDLNSDFDLESSDEHTEASTVDTPDSNTDMTAGQESSESNLEAIVIDGLPADEEASVDLFHSWEVIELCHRMGASVAG